jgi:hypothetical protein
MAVVAELRDVRGCLTTALGIGADLVHPHAHLRKSVAPFTGRNESFSYHRLAMAQPEKTTQSGRFKSAGNVIEFADDRMITSLAVRRTPLNAAIQAQAVEGIQGVRLTNAFGR